jgi:hypothetical protein
MSRPHAVVTWFAAVVLSDVAALGIASLLRFTHGAAAAIAESLSVWAIVPAALAVRRAIRTDIESQR